MINWICLPCAKRAGSKIPDGHMPTWHIYTCDVCKQSRVSVTEPRDFRPRPDQKQAIKGAQP